MNVIRPKAPVYKVFLEAFTDKELDAPGASISTARTTTRSRRPSKQPLTTGRG